MHNQDLHITIGTIYIYACELFIFLGEEKLYSLIKEFDNYIWYIGRYSHFVPFQKQETYFRI